MAERQAAPATRPLEKAHSRTESTRVDRRTTMRCHRKGCHHNFDCRDLAMMMPMTIRLRSPVFLMLLIAGVVVVLRLL